MRELLSQVDAQRLHRPGAWPSDTSPKIGTNQPRLANKIDDSQRDGDIPVDCLLSPCAKE
jgi:hypothetical protein